jgi:Cdc6-like AAA superfamily ATPase
VVERALGGVLFIDEAYMLTEEGRGRFGQEALDALLVRMEEERGRFVLVAAGYPEKMGVFRRSNPGLARRIPEENVIVFPDYDVEELRRILTGMLEKRRLVVGKGMGGTLDALLEGMVRRKEPGFGNAGEMRTLADGLERRRAARVVREGLAGEAELIEEDLPPVYRGYLPEPVPEPEEVLAELDGMVGLEDLKGYLARLVRAAQYQRLRGEGGEIEPQHLLFRGNPGTGKTTAARLVGRMYRAMGLLRKGHCVEVGRAELVAGYLGQTAIRTKEKVLEALGGVLFIDEAYALVRDREYGQEAVDTLVKLMEDHRGQLVVVAAGYPEEMGAFVESNPGLASRLGVEVAFPDYTDQQLGEVLVDLAQAEGFMIGEGVREGVEALVRVERTRKGRAFGNVRYVQNLLAEMKGRLADRVLGGVEGEDAVHLDEDARTFTLQDLPGVTSEEDSSRATRVDLPGRVRSSGLPRPAAGAQDVGMVSS